MVRLLTPTSLRPSLGFANIPLHWKLALCYMTACLVLAFINGKVYKTESGWISVRHSTLKGQHICRHFAHLYVLLWYSILVYGNFYFLHITTSMNLMRWQQCVQVCSSERQCWKHASAVGHGVPRVSVTCPLDSWLSHCRGFSFAPCCGFQL